jgi:hypothetical protein
MKKPVFLSVVLTILALMLTGCDKPEPPAPAVFYTLSTIVSGKGAVNPDKLSGIALGSNVTLKFTPETGYSLYSVKVNGVKIEDIQPSTTEVSYTIQNINKNQYIEVVFVETNILTFSVKSTGEKPWRLKLVQSYRVDDNTYLRNFPLDKEDRSDRYYYLYPSMTVVVLEEDGGVRNGTWNLKQKVLTIDGHAYPLLELTPNKFSYQTEEVWSGYDNCWIYHIVNFGRD